MASKLSTAVFTSMAPHAIDITMGSGEGLDALLEITGQIQQPTARWFL